jgi:hypothetical protein
MVVNGVAANQARAVHRRAPVPINALQGLRKGLRYALTAMAE